MVAELDITDHEVTHIAEMIDGEVGALLPHWTPGPGMDDGDAAAADDAPDASTAPSPCCKSCRYSVASSGGSSLDDYMSAARLPVRRDARPVRGDHVPGRRGAGAVPEFGVQL